MIEIASTRDVGSCPSTFATANVDEIDHRAARAQLDHAVLRQRVHDATPEHVAIERERAL